MTFSRSELTFQDFPGGVGTRRAGSPVTRRRLMPVSGSSGCACRWLSVSSAALPSLGVLHHDAASPPQPADAPGNTHTHTPFNGPWSGPMRVSRYQKGKTNLDFTEARDSEWQWHQLGHMQVCTSLWRDNDAIFLQIGFSSCHPTNSVKALKAPGNTSLPVTKHRSHFVGKSVNGL